MNEGKQNNLNVWLRQQPHESKFLALLKYRTMADLAQDMTMKRMKELCAPGTNGYTRQQIFPGDWSEPVLKGGDYESETVEKTFGPATVAWSNFTHVALVTDPIGTDGKFLFSVPLSSKTSVGVDQSFKYTLRVRAQ